MADIHINSTTTNLPDGTPVNVAEVKGAIDGTTVSEFEEEMLGFLDKGTPNLILEFSGVSYINSTGMGLLVKCADKFQEAGGDIKLVGVSPKISALFDMLGLLSLFKIFDNRDEALRAIKGGSSAAPAPSPSGGRNPAPPPPPKAPPPPPPPPAPGKMVSFPVQYKCDRPDCCTPLLPQAGKYKCPSCKILIMVDGQGSITTSGSPAPVAPPPPPPPAPMPAATSHVAPPAAPANITRKIVDLKLPCERPLLDSMKGIVIVLAKAIGASQPFVNELTTALINSAALIVDTAPPNDTFQVIFLADASGMQVGLKTTHTPFNPSPQINAIQGQVDKIEITPLQPKGQMLKLIKNRK